ncbi:MAG: hypothetical protein JWR80_6164 [Bradyrhizobium sp.]|nr:hypothetical protein [Bradyrhizobium sp.]
MSGHHATPPRGLDATRSPLFQGRFGRMFRQLPAATFGADEAKNEAALTRLATAMQASPDGAKDGADGEESAIPALYTYFGQFVDHDITFDPVSMLTKASDPDGLTDFRTPALDLDNLYGRGPGDQPYMYADNRTLALGEPLNGAGVPDAHDLPRFSKRALIGDPRNDENSIVSQLQGLFIRFHNRMAADNPSADLPTLQRLVRFHYQYVIINDFLPRIISSDVLDGLKTDGHFDQKKLKFYHWKNDPFMPVEFSVAAYRLGHSMIRPGYRLNDDDNTLLPIFAPPGTTDGLAGFTTMKQGRAIDWSRFIDLELRSYHGDVAVQKRRLQLAYRLDTSLVAPLTTLPPEVASDPPLSLGLRNLLRGWRLGLPSGQAVARAMNVPVLHDDQIMIGKAVDTEDPNDPQSKPVPIVQAAGAVFANNCPLWTYILAEAMHHKADVQAPVLEPTIIKTPRLGPVGGRIVAEVFLGMMFGDGSSMLSLDPPWHPKTGTDFRLKHIVAYALGKGGPLG